MKTPLVVCRTDRTPFTLHLARVWREQGVSDGVHALLAYYDNWRGFLETQEHAPILGIHTLTDIFRVIGETRLDQAELDRIEREYGWSSLWNILFSDSLLTPHAHPKLVTNSFYSDEDKLRYIQVSFSYFEKLIDDNGIDCILDFARVGAFRSVLDRVAAKRSIPYLYTFPALLGDEDGDLFRINTRVVDRHPDLRERYDELLANPRQIREGWEDLEKFRSGERRSIYNFNKGSKRPGKKPWWSGIRKFRPWSSLKKHAKGIHKERALRNRARQDPAVCYNFQLHKGYWSTKQKRRFLGWLRTRYVRRNVPMHTGPVDGPYVVLTLHLQPEASTSLLAPYCVNQLAAIENIARVVPLGWKVVIKPNRTMLGTDSIHFFRQLKLIPNVLITDYDAETLALIRESRAVLNISGTSGLEGALLGKPVFRLQSTGVIWHVLRDVPMVCDWEKLHAMLRDADKYTPEDASLAAYLQAVRDTSFKMERNFVWDGPYDLSKPEYADAVKTIALAMAARLPGEHSAREAA